MRSEFSWIEEGVKRYVPLSCRSLGNAGTSSKKPEERKFAIDSGASMHMVSKKNLSSGGLDTLKRSRAPDSDDSPWRVPDE